MSTAYSLAGGAFSSFLTNSLIVADTVADTGCSFLAESYVNLLVPFLLDSGHCKLESGRLKLEFDSIKLGIWMFYS